MSKKRTTPKLVYVEWEDSASFEDGWQRRSTAKELTTEKIRSVGWVLRDKKRHIVIAAHWSRAGFCGEMCIPKVAILHKFELGDVPR